ncbi:MAG: Uma2 family endonuclease [Cyclobacteriaceae bacterium]
MEYLIKTNSIGGMTEEQFFRFCQENESIHFERNAKGEIIILEPAGSYTGWYNINIATDLTIWNRITNLGMVFDSNTGFTLPNGAVRSPDASFIKIEHWEKITQEDRKKFAHICPDFVIELLSQSDNQRSLHKKMKEWMSNGCRLAWLIDPYKKETTIYRQEREAEIKSSDEVLSGEDVLPGFRLDLSKLLKET